MVNVMKKVSLIWAHPRNDSLTSKISSAVQEVLLEHEYAVNELDLYRLNFNPVLHEIDEPDWNNIDKVYSDDVTKYAENLQRSEALFIVFPIWWYSMPAILKGYIDRVWNYGITYGESRHLPCKTIRWIALAGEPQESFEKRGLDKSMIHNLNVGIAGFCGAPDSKVTILYDTLGEATDNIVDHHNDLIKITKDMALEWINSHSSQA